MPIVDEFFYLPTDLIYSMIGIQDTTLPVFPHLSPRRQDISDIFIYEYFSSSSSFLSLKSILKIQEIY